MAEMRQNGKLNNDDNDIDNETKEKTDDKNGDEDNEETPTSSKEKVLPVKKTSPSEKTPSNQDEK